MYPIYAQRAGCQLIPMLFFVNVCLLCLLINPCTWLFGDPLFADEESCWLDINNQSGKTLRVTPLYADRNPISAVRLYRLTFPNMPAYRQRNITVKPGDTVRLSYNCSQDSVSGLYACDLEGECYLHQHPQNLSTPVRRYLFTSLESLSRPDAALEAAVGSFPEHNYSAIKNVLLCLIQTIFLIAGVYGLVRFRTVAIPKDEI